MKIFVTGGDGFLGSNIVRELLSRKYAVRVLVQEGRTTNVLDGLEVEIVKGDLLDYLSLLQAAEGCEALFHIAASTSIWPSRNPVVNRINIDGTANMIRIAKEINVLKMVYIGTANSFKYGTKKNPGVEDKEYLGFKYRLDYMDSKYKAHQLVLAAVQDGLPAVVVNPCFMLGAYDSAPSSGAMIVAVYEGKVIGYSPGGRNFIYVKDAATGIVNALEKGRIGESYLIGHENLSYKEIFGKIAKEVKVAPPKLYFPKWITLMYGALGSLISALTKRKPMVSFPMAKIACDGQYYSSQKAVCELDLPQTPIEVGIKESFNWLKSNGYIQ